MTEETIEDRHGAVYVAVFTQLRNVVNIEVWPVGKERHWELTAARFIYFDDDEWVDDANVFGNYKRRGIATAIYNLIERKFDVKLHPSGMLLHDGELFWAARLKAAARHAPPLNPNGGHNEGATSE